MMSDLMVIVVATEHPDLDDWVHEQARSEAERSGWTLGAYMGREDVLPEPRPHDLCCHVFAASVAP
jgi:hypothetical protein